MANEANGPIDPSKFPDNFPNYCSEESMNFIIVDAKVK